MSTLILMRHAQASFGAVNYDLLSAKGETQARTSQRFLATLAPRISRVLVGPRVRHRQTAEFALEGLALPAFEFVDDLDEFSDSDAMLASAARRTGKAIRTGEGASREAIMGAYIEEILRWVDGVEHIDDVPPVHEYRSRVAGVMHRYMNPAQPDEVVLAVTSGGLINTALAEALGLPNRQLGEMISTFSVGNCSLSAFHDTPFGRTVLYFNQTAHLPLELASVQ